MKRLTYITTFIVVICRPNHKDFELVVRVRSFFSMPDGGPKLWRQGKILPTQFIDIHNYGLQQLVDFVAEHYMWGSKQLCTLWRDLENISCEIKSDEELLDWFLLNLDKGAACINVQMNDFEGALQCSPTKRRCHPFHRGPTNETPTNNDTPSNKRPTNEIPNPPKKPTKIQKSKKSKKTNEEVVGVNDEGMYSDTDSLAVLSDSSYDTDLAATSDSDTEFDPDEEIVDMEDEYDLPDFSYDVDDPCIDVNVVFPDVD